MSFRKEFLFFLSLCPLLGQTIRDLPAGYRTEWLAIPLGNATAISNNGYIGGFISLPDNRSRGFLRTPTGLFLDVEYPGALRTQIEGVNTVGTVVGSYTDTNGSIHGFLRTTAGVYTAFDFPGASQTVLTGINDANQVSGYFIDSANESQMFTFTNPASPQILSIAVNNRAWDIGPDGSVVGAYPSGSSWAGFNRGPGGAVAAFLSPCPSALLSGLGPLGINASYEIAGSCNFRAGLFFNRSFLRHSSGKVLIIGDSAQQDNFLLSVTGINDAGQLVGNGTSLNETRGLILHPCEATNVTPTTSTVSASGGVVTFTATTAADCRLNATRPEVQWATLGRTSNSSFQVAVEANTSPTPRSISLFVAGANVTITQSAGTCDYNLTGSPATFTPTGGPGTLTVATTAGCSWTATSSVSWITLGSTTGTGNGSLTFSVAANTTALTRTGAIVVGGHQFIINQAGDAICALNVTITGGPVPAAGGFVTLAIATGTGCPWGVSSPSTFVGIPPNLGVGPVSMQIGFGPNPSSESRIATLIVSGASYQVLQLGTGGGSTGMRFVPVTPCRVVDTRPEGGRPAGFGPPSLTAGATRDFSIPQGGCGIPTTARAYALNITVVPSGYLGYLTAFPTGQSMGGSSTLNSWNGRVVANAAIVAAGTNASVSVFVTDRTDVIIDINGYFTNDTGLAFYPVQPCRVADTRPSGGKTGQFGPPSIAGQTSRSFSIPLSGCGIPANAQAFSTNVTAVPSSYLGFLTLWPTGQSRPLASTLNSWDAQVVPNAAIVPAGANGEISVYASNLTDVVIDINGYFAPAGQPGALLFYPQSPCRLVDTREDVTATVQLTRTFPVAGRCAVPASARAYVFNATAVPNGYLGFVTLWPGGEQQPFVSTLNSWNGQVVANAAIVPAGTGSVST